MRVGRVFPGGDHNNDVAIVNMWQVGGSNVYFVMLVVVMEFALMHLFLLPNHLHHLIRLVD